MCWKHVRRCTGACIRPKMCGIESRDDVLFVLYVEKSPIPRSKQTPVEHSSLPPLPQPYDRTFCTTFRVHHTNFAVSALFLKFRGFRGFRIFCSYYIISVSKHIFPGSPELRTNQNWLYVVLSLFFPSPTHFLPDKYAYGAWQLPTPIVDLTHHCPQAVEHSFRKARQLWTLSKLPCHYFEKRKEQQGKSFSAPNWQS